MSVLTRGETFAKLIEYLRRAQEECATMAHLYRDDQGSGRAMAMGWMTVSEGLKLMQAQVTKLAQRGLQ